MDVESKRLMNLGEHLEPLLSREVVLGGFNVSVIELKLRKPMHLPFGVVETRPSGWVEVSSTNSDVKGYGEGVTLQEPLFTDDCGSNIAQNISRLAEGITDQRMTYQDVFSHIHNFNFEDGGRYPTARLALEMAVLDLLAKENSMSVASMFGVEDSIVDVPFGHSIGAATAAEIVSEAKQAINQNAEKIKIKVAPETVDAVVEAIKELKTLYNDVYYMVDANGTFSPKNKDDIKGLMKLDELGLLLIEEPVSRVGETRGLDAVRELRQLMPNLRTDICLDDCLATADDCWAAINEDLAQVVNIKPGRIGSFIESVVLADELARQGKQAMVGGMFEATPGRYMTTTLAAYCVQKGFKVAGDLSPAQNRLVEDLVDHSSYLQVNSEGKIGLQRSTGWGFEVKRLSNDGPDYERISNSYGLDFVEPDQGFVEDFKQRIEDYVLIARAYGVDDSAAQDVMSSIVNELENRKFLKEALTSDQMNHINTAETAKLADKIVDIQKRIETVEVNECGENLTSLTEVFLKNNVTASFSELPFHEACGSWAGKNRVFWVRKEFAERLVFLGRIAEEIGFYVHFEDAFRPKEVQEGLFRRRWAWTRRDYPSWNDKQVLAETMSKTACKPQLASHMGGAAVDLRLRRLEDSSFLDIGHAYPNGGAIVQFDSPFVTQLQWRNRVALKILAAFSGLTLYPGEDWHLSYGDNLASLDNDYVPASDYIANYGPLKSVNLKNGEIQEAYSKSEMSEIFDITTQ